MPLPGKARQRQMKQAVASEHAVAKRVAEEAKLATVAGGERVDTMALAPDGSYGVPKMVVRSGEVWHRDDSVPVASLASAGTCASR
ncbi:hypothetical protein H6F76_09105 [Leptolyngbya sp. FACHB-321]|uniref:hypothetical protein n=1 Tax=Leptolyngbya sp. FACHB-321 TaxID=2692807 RepID=UPI0016865866|nr:hypothetical protein [Leptolyngbya sp. FACHB-321]MBD2035184.1 hypothetical protein [Leptolyngbya sp. FACHB-321]